MLHQLHGTCNYYHQLCDLTATKLIFINVIILPSRYRIIKFMYI